MPRTPFPVPYGWYQIGWPNELEPGDVVPLFFFELDLVLWRDETGEYHLQDAICPHLGGHLGHGGHVEDCQLQCPFHGWKFDPCGNNSEIPYSTRTNAQAKLRTYPLINRNGILLAWYHPFDEEPKWEIPELEEFKDGTGWSGDQTKMVEIPAAWQEVAENSVDIAHFRFLHNTEDVAEAKSYEADGHMQRVRTVQKFVTPQGVVEGNIDIDQYGPGFSVIRFSGIVDTILLGNNTPVTANTCEQRFTFRVKDLGDARTNSSVGDAFVAEISQQITEDLPIWRNKAYIVKPALADTDGPYMQFRKWAMQFYAEGVDFDQPVYPALQPTSSHPEPEGFTKHTASAKIKEEDQIRAGMMN